MLVRPVSRRSFAKTTDQRTVAIELLNLYQPACFCPNTDTPSKRRAVFLFCLAQAGVLKSCAHRSSVSPVGEEYFPHMS